MSKRVARIITSLSLFAMVARTIALVSRSATVRAIPPKPSRTAGAPVPAAGGALAPTPTPAPAPAPSAGDPDAAPSTLPAGPVRSELRSLVALSLVALELVAVLSAFVAPAPVRALLILAAAVALPGAAITVRLNLGDALTTIGLTVALGLTVDVLVALAMVWTGWFHPVAAAVVVGAASTASLAAHLRGAMRLGRLRVADPARAFLALLPAGAALAVWAVSLTHNVDLVHLRSFGLPVGLGVTWYAALALALAGSVVAAATRRPRGLLIGIYIATLTLIIFGTLPALTHVAPYSWTYKHIGVTSLIEQTGTVHPSVDIYNRWPGFFAVAASFAKLTGLAPISFAAWFEPLFVALDALLVAVAARAMSGRARVAGWAALLFVVSNFVGQDYYSPQGLVYVLSLAALVLVVRQLTDPDALPRWIRAALTRLSGRKPSRSSIERLPISRATSIALIVLLQAAIVATHQLTPYVLVGEVAALTVLGVMRPRWLAVVLALLALAYLAPNFEFVRHQFGLWSGFNPLGNASVATFGGGQPWAVINGGSWVSKLLSVMALVAAVRLVRLGGGRTVVIVGVLALVPFGILLASSYGGEASLRVFLFSSPWRIVLVAWGLASIGRTQLRLLIGGVAVAALAALTLPTFLGRAPLVVMPPGEVTAAQYFYAHAPAGSSLTLAAPDFPTRVEPRYAAMADPDEDVNLMLDPALRDRQLGAADIQKAVDFMNLYSHSGYLVFASSEYRYAAATSLLPAGSLASLQRAVAQSGRFRLWYRTRDASIYQLVNP
jgi:hypothetical protein